MLTQGASSRPLAHSGVGKIDPSPTQWNLENRAELKGASQ